MTTKEQIRNMEKPDLRYISLYLQSW